MKIVCDTNVVIDFSKLRRLEILKGVFKEVSIPFEVKEELMAGESEELPDIESALNTWIIAKPVIDRLAIDNLNIHLGIGESASMVLYKESGADLLAINDLKARGVAHALGIKIIGTLGILQLAKEGGIIKQIKPLLDELIKIGAYLSSSLYTRILKDAGEA
jgi:predicted nucleic acid-binding protein